MTRVAVVLGFLLTAVAPAVAQTPPTNLPSAKPIGADDKRNVEELPVIPVGLDAYRQWQRWPYQRIGVRAYMRSTYDRSGGNEGADASHFLYQTADDFNVTLDVGRIKGDITDLWGSFAGGRIKGDITDLWGSFAGGRARAT